MLHTTIEKPVASGARVYSYTRFSTPEQASGDSRRRQSDAARTWAERRGLVLDERLSLQDEGVSAYRGTNTDEDRGLGGFLLACRSGLITPGSYLLVESLDRISRMTPRKAQRLIDDIVDAGVTICTLNDGQEYDAVRLDSDPTALLIGIMVAWRANEESKTKGRRVAEAWAEKRRRVRSGEDAMLTRRAVGWLQWKGEKWIEKAPHADAVRSVFKMTLDGLGEHKIAAALNAKRVPTMGRSKVWHRSTVAKILRNPAVIGTLHAGYMDFSSGKRQRVVMEGIANAFPAVISEADWLAVRTIKADKNAVRGRGAKAPLSNIFAGLARCPECGAAMTRVHKASGAKPRLVCTLAKLGAAEHAYRSVYQETVEVAFLEHWQQLLIDVPAGISDSQADRDHADLQGVIAQQQDTLEHLADLSKRQPSVTLASQIKATEAQLDVLRRDLATLSDRRIEADHGLVQERIGTLADALGYSQDNAEPLDVAKVNAALKVLFSGVTVDYLSGLLRFQWRQGGEGAVTFSWPS